MITRCYKYYILIYYILLYIIYFIIFCLPDLRPGLTDCGHVAARHVEYPGVQLSGLWIHQEEGGAVSIDQLLGLVHDLQDQSVHADHLLEYRPGNRNKVESTLESLHLLDHIEKEVRGLSLPADPAVLMDEVEADLNPGEGGLQLTSDPWIALNNSQRDPVCKESSIIAL